MSGCTEDQLGQAQKTEAVGTLPGGVAHDLNNLLSVITTYTLLVMEELKADDPSLADLEEVRVAAEKAAELVRGVLDAVTPRRGASESASGARSV